MNQYVAWILAVGMLVYFAVELGWGGGDPKDPHHNRPPWSMW